MKSKEDKTEKINRGNRLFELRSKKNLKQAEVAEYLDIEPDTYGKYERGETTPSFKNIKKLAEKYNTTTDFIIYGTTPDYSAQFSEYIAKCPNDKLPALLSIIEKLVEAFSV